MYAYNDYLMEHYLDHYDHFRGLISVATQKPEKAAEEIDRLVRDIAEDRLSDIELSAWVVATYTRGLSLAETMHLTQCMTNAGHHLTWDESVVADKHSIGGVAGNRVTPIIVAIVAAAGVTIPKTSSRAVTSPAGTADTMEVFCDVEFSTDEIRDVVAETNGCLVWGGGVNLSPVDDKIIRAETPLSLDPHGQLIASVLSKKRSAGSTHVVIDMPKTLVTWTETVLQASHVYFAMLQLDLRSAQNAQRMIRALKSEDLPVEKLRYVLNRSPGFANLTGRSRVKRLAGSLDIKLEVQLPDGGRAVSESGDNGLPLAMAAPKSPLRKEIRKLYATTRDPATCPPFDAERAN